MFWRAATWCSVLQCGALCCSVLQCVPMCCSVLQCAIMCCSVLQCAALCCTVLHCVAIWYSVLHCVAVWCSVLQCVATRCSIFAMSCSVLQCVAGILQVLRQSGTQLRGCNQPKSVLQNLVKSLQHAATRCNTLQHTSMHCNTLHHGQTSVTKKQGRKIWYILRGGTICTVLQMEVQYQEPQTPLSSITSFLKGVSSLHPLSASLLGVGLVCEK